MEKTKEMLENPQDQIIAPEDPALVGPHFPTCKQRTFEHVDLEMGDPVDIGTSHPSKVMKRDVDNSAEIGDGRIFISLRSHLNSLCSENCSYS